MHAAGRSLDEMGDYIGHASAYTYMTDRYRHLIEGQRQEAVRRVRRVPLDSGQLSARWRMVWRGGSTKDGVLERGQVASQP